MAPWRGSGLQGDLNGAGQLGGGLARAELLLRISAVAASVTLGKAPFGSSLSAAPGANTPSRAAGHLRLAGWLTSTGRVDGGGRDGLARFGSNRFDLGSAGVRLLFRVRPSARFFAAREGQQNQKT